MTPGRASRRLWLALVLGVVLGAAAPAPAPAQVRAAGILVVNQERLLTGSQRGQAILAAEEEARERLRAEARAIDNAFEEEERALTDRRAGLDAADFRALADAFDARVVTARRDQDARAAALAAEFDAGRRRFYAAVAPILVGLMERYGAQAILDENIVLMAAQGIDITDAAIAEIDAMPGADAPADSRQSGPGDAPGPDQ